MIPGSLDAHKRSLDMFLSGEWLCDPGSVTFDVTITFCEGTKRLGQTGARCQRQRRTRQIRKMRRLSELLLHKFQAGPPQHYHLLINHMSLL